MNKNNLYNRREFSQITALASMEIWARVGISNSFATNWDQVVTANGITAAIPMPIQVVIDDVGWWSGKDGSNNQEPYRTGIQRNHVPADYQAIVDFGKALGIRPQAAMVLCEWDRENILSELPTSTWMGKNWDNRKWIGPWMEEAADIIRNNQNHFEFTIHGIGHEYWQNDTFTRAEWADNDGNMRPRDQIEKHLEYFSKIMDQHKLGEFPQSFVPTAFRHGFGPTQTSDISLADILYRHGVTYINTPFRIMQNAQNVKHKWFGFDGMVMTIDRGQDLFKWLVIGKSPSGTLAGPTCGMHWPNLLDPDPDKNLEIVKEWVTFLAPYNDKPDTMLAPNSLAFRQQLAHHECTQISIADKKISLNFKDTDILPDTLDKSEIILKVSSPTRLSFNTENVKIVSESVSNANGYLYTIELERTKKSSKAVLNVTKKFR